MQNTWPTEERDLDVAADIINKHIAYNGGQPLELIKVIVDREQDNTVDVQVSNWVMELTDYFRNRYGYEHGQAVMSNILTKILLQHETIH